METSKKDEVLAFIREHPGCTSTAIADELYGKWRWSGWIFVRRDTDALFEEGLIGRREFRGIKTYYPVEQLSGLTASLESDKAEDDSQCY